jgi:hypothetical protein
MKPISSIIEQKNSESKFLLLYNYFGLQVQLSKSNKSFFYRPHILWNELPYDLRSIESPSIFNNRLLAHQWYIDDFMKSSMYQAS